MKYIPKTDSEIRDAIRSKDFDSVIRSTWPLAMKIAKKYSGYDGYEFEDAMQDALLEIHRAALAFRLDGPVPFLAVAKRFMINQLISRKIEVCRPIALSRATSWNYNKVNRAVENGADFEDECRKVGMTPETHKAVAAAEEVVRIDGMADWKEIRGRDDATKQAMDWALRKSIRQAMRHLTQTEKLAIIGKMDGATQEETARKIGVSNQRISQAYRCAIRKLKKEKKRLQEWMYA